MLRSGLNYLGTCLSYLGMNLRTSGLDSPKSSLDRLLSVSSIVSVCPKPQQSNSLGSTFGGLVWLSTRFNPLFPATSPIDELAHGNRLSTF